MSYGCDKNTVHFFLSIMTGLAGSGMQHDQIEDDRQDWYLVGCNVACEPGVVTGL